MYRFVVVLLLLLPTLAQAADVVDLDQVQATFSTAETEAPASVDLGTDVRRGVEAHGRLEARPMLDLSQPLAESMHHFAVMIRFRQQDDSKILLEGQVAARSFSADDRVMQTVRLEVQGDEWTGDLALPATGETMIKIGSKLADGKKRIFRFFYDSTPPSSAAGEGAPAG